MLAMHLSLRLWVFFLQCTKPKHNTALFLMVEGTKTVFFFSLVFVSQLSAVWFNVKADLAVIFTVYVKSTQHASGLR